MDLATARKIAKDWRDEPGARHEPHRELIVTLADALDAVAREVDRNLPFGTPAWVLQRAIRKVLDDPRERG